MKTEELTLEEYKAQHLNKDLAPVHITFVIDRSGSMATIANDVEGGINSFIEEQRKVPGDCKVTIWEFDTVKIEKVVKDINIHSAKYGDFSPRGSTPLYDAIGKAILDIDSRDKEEKQIVVVMTDGYENSSREFNQGHIFNMIKDREEKGWIFTYLAANQDAFDIGGRMGFAATMDFAPTGQGVKNLYASNTVAVANLRTAWAKGDNVSSAQLYNLPDENGTAKNDSDKV